jgi:hypothetical protein
MRTLRQYIEVARSNVTNVTHVISAVIPWGCLVTCGARVCHCTCHLSLAVTYEVTSKSSTCHQVSLRNHAACDVCDVCDVCLGYFYVLAG